MCLSAHSRKNRVVRSPEPDGIVVGLRELIALHKTLLITYLQFFVIIARMEQTLRSLIGSEDVDDA